MHFEREPPDPVLARIFRGILPVRNDFFFPLPVLHLGVLGRPAIGDPVRLGILRSAARAAGKTDDHFYIQHFGEENGLAERVDIFLRVLRIGMNGVAMTTESGDANPAVLKFFQPGFCLSAVFDQVVERTMMIIRVAAGADLHRFKTEGAEFVEWARTSPPGTAAASKPLVAARNSLRPIAEFLGCFFMRLPGKRSSGMSTKESAGIIRTMYGSGKQANRFSIDLGP